VNKRARTTVEHSEQQTLEGVVVKQPSPAEVESNLELLQQRTFRTGSVRTRRKHAELAEGALKLVQPKPAGLGAVEVIEDLLARHITQLTVCWWGN